MGQAGVVSGAHAAVSLVKAGSSGQLELRRASTPPSFTTTTTTTTTTTPLYTITPAVNNESHRNGLSPIAEGCTQSLTDPKSDLPALILGVLCAFGGTMGYVRQGSVPSIVAGISVGALYIYGGMRIRARQPYGVETALLASIVLAGSSWPRAIKVGFLRLGERGMGGCADGWAGVDGKAVTDWTECFGMFLPFVSVVGWGHGLMGRQAAYGLVFYALKYRSGSL